MLKELLRPEILELIEQRKWNDLRDGLSNWPPPEIAEVLLDIDKQDRAMLFRVLPRDISAEVFSYLEYDQRDELLRDLNDHETKILLANLTPDDRTALLEELPGKVTRRMLNLLSPEDLKEARELLGYPEESVGRLMTPDFVAVKKDWTVAQALSHIRIFGKASETIYRIYVVDEKGKLLDDIMLRNIILANENETIANLMDYTVISISAFADQEEAVRYLEKYDISALPVVDSDGQIVGIVTFDDIMDISTEEITEDIQKYGAVNPVDKSYMSASVFTLWMKRIPWLLALLFTSFISAGVIEKYSELIQTFVALSFFIPMLNGSAGNTGTQSSTLILRGLATGDIEIGDWFKVLVKELLVGISLGLVLGGLAFARGYFDSHGTVNLALVIGISMIALVFWANIIGALLPIVLAKFKLDPAVISSPFMATFIDVTGVFIYLNVANYLLVS